MKLGGRGCTSSRWRRGGGHTTDKLEDADGNELDEVQQTGILTFSAAANIGCPLLHSDRCSERLSALRHRRGSSLAVALEEGRSGAYPVVASRKGGRRNFIKP